MTTECIQRRLVLLAGVTALLAAAALAPAADPAAHAADATTYRECYKSIRSCQKSRCSKQDGQEQVSCMQQCNREYDSCAGAAGSGVGALGFPQKASTPVTKKQRRNLQRNQTGGDQN
jgi:hypothetical protein